VKIQEQLARDAFCGERISACIKMYGHVVYGCIVNRIEEQSKYDGFPFPWERGQLNGAGMH